VSALIGRWAGPVDARVACIGAERTNRNPLVAMEVATLLRGPDQEMVAAESLPPTVLALITGRVDRLPLEARNVLEAAAVLGRDFGRLPLAGVLGSRPVQKRVAHER